NEQDLVEVGHALAAIAVRRLGSRRVFLEACQPDVTVRLVLDEAVGPGADELLDLAVARRVDHALGMDRGTSIGTPEAEEERAGRLLEVDHDRRRILGLDRLDVLPDSLPGTRDLPPAIERCN